MPRKPSRRVMHQRCDIQRQTVGQDRMGGITRDPQSWTECDVRCQVRPLSSSNPVRHNKEGLEITHRVYFDGDLEIDTSDRLRLPDGTILVVAGRVDANTLGRIVAVECYQQVE